MKDRHRSSSQNINNNNKKEQTSGLVIFKSQESGDLLQSNQLLQAEKTNQTLEQEELNFQQKFSQKSHDQVIHS